ncbi:MAG: InlB B-repeat-containing protein [Tissierellales bacterium]|nr:InlB B-repeat-containing protein [Tissierellales bacterium]
MNRIKRIISLVLVVSMLVSLSSNAVYAADEISGYSDMVSPDDWSYNALSTAVQNGIIKMDKGRVRPYDELNRAEMITMILRALGIDNTDENLSSYMCDISSFEDVSESDWYYNEMSIAYKLKLIKGTGETTLSPKAVTTREQAFTVLARVLELRDTSMDITSLDAFVDTSDISNWALHPIAMLVRNGYVSGYNGYLNPNEIMTRQEFAQILFNLFENCYVKDANIAQLMSGKIVDSNVIITGRDLTLSDVEITGDLIIGDGVGNSNVTLENVHVGGRLIIRGGGENGIHLNNSSFNSVIVRKLSEGNIGILGDEKSVIDNMEITDGNNSIIVDVRILRLILSGDNLDIVVKNSIESAQAFGDYIKLSGNGTLNQLELFKGVHHITVEIPKMILTNSSENEVIVIDKSGKENFFPYGEKAVTSAIGYYNEWTSTVRSSSPRVFYQINFHSNGGSNISMRNVLEDKSLGGLPVPIKSSYVFVGWYTDDETFVNEVNSNTIVTDNMDLYANYFESVGITEVDASNKISVSDVAKDYEIQIVSSDSSMTASDVLDGMTFESLSEDSNVFSGIEVIGGKGIFSVVPKDGYTPNCSYTLTLDSDKLTFSNQTSTIRVMEYSTELGEPELNVSLCEDVKIIPASTISDVTENGMSISSLSTSLYSIGSLSTTSSDAITETFTYLGSEIINIGDKLAVYVGTKPEERIAGTDYSDEDINYVLITSKDGSTFGYTQADPEEIIFMPDLIPVKNSDDADGDSSNNSLIIEVEKLTFDDQDDYNDFDLEEFVLDASTTIDVGDYIVFYSSADALCTIETDPINDDLVYGLISSVKKYSGYYVINYTNATYNDYDSYFSITVSQEMTFDQLTETIDIQAISEDLTLQIQSSGFADAAAEYLIELAKSDEITRAQLAEEMGVTDFKMEEVSAQGLFGDGPKVDVNFEITKDLKHFTGEGLRIVVVVSCEVDLNDDLKFVVSGSFAEELIVRRNLSTEKKRVVVNGKKINERFVYASIDVYSYTYLGLKLNLYSEKKSAFTDKLDIVETIKDIKELADTSVNEADSKISEFYELYQEMMDIEHGYFELFAVEMCSIEGPIDPLYIVKFGFTAEFVVSLNADISLGAQFSYEKGTRYAYTFMIKSSLYSKSTTNLLSERYEFTLYAMGTVAIRAGVRLSLQVGLFSIKLDSIGISAEAGAYFQIWGFLYYHLLYQNNQRITDYSGALYMELGTYVTIKFIAQALDKTFKYSKEIYGDSWPLWNAGEQYYTYDFNYTLTDDTDDFILKGESSSYVIPSGVYRMKQMDFVTGDLSEEKCDYSNFNFLIKNDINKAFSVSSTGVITVNPPVDSLIETAILEVTWKTAPLAFTSAPISRIFTLYWDNLADSYAMTFDSNGGNTVQTIQGAYNSSITLPTPIKTGYNFDGWYTDNNTFLNSYSDNKMPAVNQTLYAKWTPQEVKYTVRHYQQSLDKSQYELVNSQELLGTAGSTTSPLLNTYSGFSAPMTESIIIKGDGSSIVNYYYDRNTYTMTFNKDDGSENIIKTYPYGTEITSPTVERNGYTFIGWDSTVPSTVPASNTTYTALWTKKAFTINYDLAGGSVSSANATTYAVDTATITLNNPTRSGYQFVGWTGTGLSQATEIVTIPMGSTGNRYYTATWKEITYLVYHYQEDLSDNYSILSDIDCIYGVAGEQTQAVGKSYTGFTAKAITQSSIAADGTTVISVYYDRNTYKIHFMPMEGIFTDASLVEPIEVKYGETLAMPTAVSFEGYILTGWNTTEARDGVTYNEDVPIINLTTVDQADIHLYAVWTKRSLSGSGAFGSKYSATYQVFDFILNSNFINGRAYDSSWGNASFSTGHQFTVEMINGRYFTLVKTGDVNYPVALYMYESDGTRAVHTVSTPVFYDSSQIGMVTNETLMGTNCTATLQNLYGNEWEKGLLAVGTVNYLWTEGFMFMSSNGFGYYISGKTAMAETGTQILTNQITNPTIDQLEAVQGFATGPLTITD